MRRHRHSDLWVLQHICLHRVLSDGDGDGDGDDHVGGRMENHQIYQHRALFGDEDGHRRDGDDSGNGGDSGDGGVGGDGGDGGDGYTAPL